MSKGNCHDVLGGEQYIYVSKSSKLATFLMFQRGHLLFIIWSVKCDSGPFLSYALSRSQSDSNKAGFDSL